MRKYREELSWLAVRNGNRVFSSEEDFNGGTKPVNDTRPFPAHKYCWNAIQNAARSSMQEVCLFSQHLLNVFFKFSAKINSSFQQDNSVPVPETHLNPLLLPLFTDD